MRPSEETRRRVTRSTLVERLDLAPSAIVFHADLPHTLHPQLEQVPDRLDQPIPFGTRNAVELQRRADVDRLRPAQPGET